MPTATEPQFPFKPTPPIVIDHTMYANFQEGDSPSERHWKEVNARKYAEMLQAQLEAKPAPPTQEECTGLLVWALGNMAGDPEKATSFLLEGAPVQRSQDKRVVDQIVRHLVYEELRRIAAAKSKGAKK